jgi:hypothetical protein
MTDKKKSKFADVAEKVTKLRLEPPATASPAPPVSAPPAPPQKMGRPPGKKTDPNYVQVTVYLRKSNHQAAKKILIDQEREFSELVDDLVTRWIENPTV